ncbi:MAG: tetratricopeptide repeat protein [Trebonia sp.]
MASCDRPDCGRGEIDEQGYCTACDRPPLVLPPPGPTAPPEPPEQPEQPEQQPGGAGAAARPEPWWGLALVGHSAVPPPPHGPAGPDGVVPEEQRFCVNGHPVGRGRDGRPGRVDGFCGVCRTRFDFTSPGADQTAPVIAGRYEVKRTLGTGSFGAALLAFDRNLGVDVVLKDLSRSRAVAATAQRERDALTGLRHDSIVRIYGFETKGPYLVLEYVQGTTLEARPTERLEVILGHGLQILQALDYLHARGLLHIDVKPANVVRFGERAPDGPRDRVRLIDFGTVWELGVPGPVDSYTVAYAPPQGDREHASPTARFDLFCLGMTLQELCRHHLPQGDRPSVLPQEDKPGVRSLSLLLDRATDVEDPARRLTSARQFAEQLSGVIRQVVAAPPVRRRITRQSSLFAPLTEPLHCGLGAPRPLGHWVNARLSADGRLTTEEPFTRPQPADVVTALPAPLADPGDRELSPDRVALLADCRAALRRGDLGAADSSLTQANPPEWSWARAWHAGLIAVARNDPAAASLEFGNVRRALPGELVPLLALGLTAEMADRLDEARRYYKAVVDTAPAVSAAGFGLARVYLRDGKRAKAVATATQLAAELKAMESRFEREARIAVVRLRAAVLGTSLPDEADLTEAAKLAASLGADTATEIALSTEIEYGRFLVTKGWFPLSEQLRSLARQAGIRPTSVSLVDLANQLRPPVNWRLRPSRQMRDRSTVKS